MRLLAACLLLSLSFAIQALALPATGTVDAYFSPGGGLVLKGNQTLTDRYIRNYEEHKAHGVPYEFTPKARSRRK